ncbi:hypothetical protein YPPY32_2951, partial [Yersinia pestis PY-32]
MLSNSLPKAALRK